MTIRMKKQDPHEDLELDELELDSDPQFECLDPVDEDSSAPPIQIVSDLVKDKLLELAQKKSLYPFESVFHKIGPARENFLSTLSKRASHTWNLPVIWEPHSNINLKTLPQDLSKIASHSPFFIIRGLQATPLDMTPYYLARQLASVRGIFCIQHDLILEPYQIYEARAYGFDAVSIYPSCLSNSELLSLVLLAKELGMETILWLRSRQDIAKAVRTPCRLYAVSSSDGLKTMEDSEEQMIQLASEIPQDKFLILEPSHLSPAMVQEARDLECLALVQPLKEIVGKVSRRIQTL